MYPVLGASLLSAAASLPLHLMPFLVVTLVAEARLPLAQAGWIASAYMGGQLLAAALLPAAGMTRLSARHAAVAALVLAAGPWLSVRADARDLLACWFGVGVACGALQFLGATTAAASPQRLAAFSLRLGAILVASSAAIVVLNVLAGFAGYAALATQLCLILALLGAAGLALYRPPPQQPPNAEAGSNRRVHWLGLAAVFVVFAGQPGFWAYAVQGAQQKGIALQGMAYAIAACKALSVLVLIAAIRRTQPAPQALLGPGLAVGAGVLVMAHATQLAPFIVGVLLWELAVNVLSVRFQAAVVSQAGSNAAPWLAATIFLGAAAGPVLHGLAIQAQARGLFVMFAAASALVPYLWSLRRPVAAAQANA